MDNYIIQVYKKTNLKEGESCLERFLELLYLKNSLSTKELAGHLLLPIPVATAIKKEFQKCELVEQKNGITLSLKGRAYVENELGYLGIDLKLLNNLLESYSIQETIIDNLSNKYSDIFDARPIVDVTVDQAKGTPKTAFKRAMLCLISGSLIGKRVLCVGDDDYVSIALGLLLKYIGCKSDKTQICVFDIDQRFLDEIDKIKLSLDLPIKCCRVDLRDPLPIEFSNSFDAFFTDPPYTLGGMSLFLSRGISALKKKSGLNVFFSFGNKPINESIEMQKIFSNLGLIIEEIFKNFNKYEGASLYGGFSQMIVLKTSEELNSIIEARFDDALYTFDFKKSKHSYVCKKCNKIIVLNKGETIENLKSKGCPYCGGSVFTQKHNTYKEIKRTTKQSLGNHILIDFYGCNPKILNDENMIRTYMFEAAELAKASIVAENFHLFSPYGVSGAIIIQESHFTIHTWPEYGYAAVDLFTCGNNLDLQKAMHFLEEKFECDYSEFNNILRGLLKKCEKE